MAMPMATTPSLPANALRRPNSTFRPIPLSVLLSSSSAYGNCCHLVTRTRRREKSKLFSSLPLPRAEKGRDEEHEEEAFSVLTAIRSSYNEIVVVDTPKSRVLLLDSTHNVHSILNKGQKLTGSYWDEFATLPAIVPKGPIAILGLGAGTAAQIMLDFWPSLHLEGWEIDDILIDKAREYFGLSDLEKCTDVGGFLSVNIGDALSPSASIPGGFAGIVVDLFSDGKVLPQLQQVGIWLELEKRLIPDGRIMVNCGGAHSETSKGDDGSVDPKFLPDSSWIQNSTIKALCKSFPGKLSWKRMAEKESDNYLALTGPLPDFDSWFAAVPNQLRTNVNHWKACELA